MITSSFVICFFKEFIAETIAAADRRIAKMTNNIPDIIASMLSLTTIRKNPNPNKNATIESIPKKVAILFLL